ncbi:glycoside hydrolase family 65 [Pullulanibacillus sp. KACC 23026]|nr:glycoside hydrolase family 65 [Pullulanibacillus sp. KACC 23026]WEG14890.1 glycoside hydrolase family 65 [Pullulanibacillus sp. KACC 23026]
MERQKVIQRHFPHYDKPEPLSPLSVGNGRYAFTADITGLQSFPRDYEVPLGHQSEWAWHFKQKPELYNFEDIKLQKLETYGRQVPYPLRPEDKEEAYHWLRQNPHRLNLGQIGFRLLKENNEVVVLADLIDSDQVLNLWEGVLYSRFSIEGQPVSVITVCHPITNEIGVKVNSSLICSGRLQVFMRFPSPEIPSTRWEEAIFPNYEGIKGHQTIVLSQTEDSVRIQRKLDEDNYEVGWQWSSGDLQQVSTHEWRLVPDKQAKECRFTVSFAAEVPENHCFEAIYKASKEHWEQFWMSGGAIDFSGSTDSRAAELERRVVLSQFLTAVHCAGSMPPQETGYMYNSWFGKFHLEMHWWHGVHFALWGREELLVKSLDWYLTLLPYAKQLAEEQGYKGARWPKQIGIDRKQSPSPIAPLLIWQQPHPIALAEYYYRANPNREVLVRWKDIIKETADFMVSYVVWEDDKQAYVLGPPLIPSQECHDPNMSKNPPYELEYWKFGLELAANWMERLGEEGNPKWLDVSSRLSMPPHNDGVYLAHENCSNTFEQFNHDHPSMVAALGLLPGHLIDSEMMRHTLKRVQTDWQWETAWGWDFPMCAMTAARLGEGDLAINFLLMDTTKNTYLPNGHNYQTPSLSCYLPGNGGLLTALSMMIRGWEGTEDQSLPGFPRNGKWKIQWEGLHPMI